MSELLLPVGNYKMCLAAIHNGADAIYVGMPGFNARGRSHDHELEELKEIIDTCHLYGVKVHVAFNILIFENEIQSAIEKLDQVIKLGPDAFIVQDIGLIKIINQRYPKIVVHASTQMTVTNHEAIELLKDLNIQRFVLGRENTIDEIKKIKSETTKELEVFVHGALCVAYSGQCFTSESLGGRSANRGKCAQSCRFNYEIYVDGEKQNLGNIEYLVSPKDLCGIEEVPQLQEIGVESFKIEGRLKSPEFVGTAARSYKKALSTTENIQHAKDVMEVSYSRGFYTGWLHGVAHQELVDGISKSHRGKLLGKVCEIKKNKVSVITKTKVSKGDGILLLSPTNEEMGAKVFDVTRKNDKIEIHLPNSFNLDPINEEFEIYLNSSDSLKKQIQQSYTNQDLQKRIPIEIHIDAKLNLPLSIEAFDGQNRIKLKSEQKLLPAQNSPLSEESIIEALSKLGRTAYTLSKIEINLEPDLFLHNRELKGLKNKMVEMLNSQRIKTPLYRPINIEPVRLTEIDSDENAKLNILVRKKEQLETIVDNIGPSKSINYLILDFEFGKDYFESVKMAQEKGFQVAIATTRILKPFEYHNFRLIERCKPDAILVRNLGALNYFQNSYYRLLGDFSLNCANSHTLSYLKNKNLETVCASYDVGINQLNEMIKNSGGRNIEVTLHQYMPEFHMEHCVFAAFLSQGNSFRDCGKPCEKHQVHLKDMYGNRHELKADQECRNTMFSAKASSTVKYVSQWLDLGIQNFRFECLHEDGDTLINKINAYISLLEGKISTQKVYEIIGSEESYGLGVGNLDFSKKHKSRKKLNSPI